MYDWTFDGANGQTTNLPEAVANNTGTVSGAGSITTTGAPVGTGAFSRTGGANSDLISVNSTFDPPSTAYTIGAWIKTSQANYPNIFSWTSTGVQYASEFRLVGGRLQANQFYLDWYNQSVTGTTAVNDNAWHFVAVTRQFGGGTSLFADTAFQVTDSSAIDAARLTGYPARLSGNTFFAGNPYSFNGSLDDVSIWDARLSETQLKSINNLGLSDLDYNAQNAAALFDVYNSGTASSVGGRNWYKATGLAGNPGDVVTLPEGNYGVVLDGSGGGVTSVPEPGTVAMLFSGGLMLLLFGRVYRRRLRRPLRRRR